LYSAGLPAGLVDQGSLAGFAGRPLLTVFDAVVVARPVAWIVAVGVGWPPPVCRVAEDGSLMAFVMALLRIEGSVVGDARMYRPMVGAFARCVMPSGCPRSRVQQL